MLAARGELQKYLFAELLAFDNFSGAWLCLKSAGWRIDDLKGSLETLASRANNEDLYLVAEAWLSELQYGY